MSQYTYLQVNPELESFLGSEELPIQLGMGGLFLCQSGEAVVSLDLKRYRVNAGDLVVVFPNTILQTISRSEAFTGFGLAVNIDFILSIPLPESPLHYVNIKEHPCITPTTEAFELLASLCRELVHVDKHREHPFYRELIDHRLMILCYEIVTIYLQGNPLHEVQCSRLDEIFQQFLFALTRHYHTERSVEFYARQVCLSPRYLSAVVKTKSGKSVSEWIADHVILRAKQLLSEDRLTVQQIADTLHFPNASFFGQYFKKYTGMPPYRYKVQGDTGREEVFAPRREKSKEER